MKIAIACLAALGCSRSEPPPPSPSPPPVAVAVAVVADAAPDAMLIDAPIDAAIDAPPTAEELAWQVELKKINASKPCCCALASTTPEYQTQPHRVCQGDTHGTCVAASNCPARGSLAATIETWFLRVAVDAPELTGFPFDAEIQAPAGSYCTNPTVIHATDVAGITPPTQCFASTVGTYLPFHRAWRAGWGCPKRPATDNATRIFEDRTRRGDTLRCATKDISGSYEGVETAGVFVALRDGKVTALLIGL